jgi:hypothetical protein
MRESRTSGFVRGARSNMCPYRDPNHQISPSHVQSVFISHIACTGRSQAGNWPVAALSPLTVASVPVPAFSVT